MKRGLFYLVVALQALFLVTMSVSYYAMDHWGEKIKLETEPVDPRDPFYGDYVTLQYEIESFSEDQWRAEQIPNRGDIVYLIVEEDGEGTFELVEASPHSSEPSEGQVELKAKYEWHNRTEQIHQVSIGLDRYFIEENTGEDFEQTEQHVVEVIQAPWGQRKITSIE
ncbi:GDYXXLXY domain-containing protein [Halobacillus sp. A5]|uniref:GDYXXLXY domain-containing protein n=1 Tax=Halobacillus sp. A5 TaxID=2880263 RepID=UPI0020A6C8A5|nr:GDYXXLXY domain-containing protein [Halobacillus sp. A5]MCP3026714.1 GDYXXLXY domain-containing protein [Halobacillus sp. A5]